MAELNRREGLLNGAYQIRDEQQMNGNTAARIGQMFVDIINAMVAMGGEFIDIEQLDAILKQIDLEDYLKKADADKKYLSIVDAARNYLSKVDEDSASELITFLKGIAFGEGDTGIDKDGKAVLNSVAINNTSYGINSEGEGTFKDVSGNTMHSTHYAHDMTKGIGWDVDSDGNMQVESLEVRSALRVLELVYNRLSAEESEYVFTESGTIKEIETLGGGRYKIIMEKRGDTDFHAFRVGDVLRGIVNNLSNLGGGEYYTTWLHVESIDPHGDNSMVVSMYPASDCPSGKNYEPTSLMVVQRWGNSIPATKENHENPEYRAIIDLVDGKYVNRRQSCWYLSSNEKRIAMLDGVNQPKVSKGNYAAFFGLPYDIDDISGHSLNPSQPYLYCRGAFIQDLHFIDYLGKVIKMERFRGNWDADVASSIDPYVTNSNTYDTVYHNNSKWECIASQAKGEPSKDNKDEWKLLQEVLSTSIIQLVPSATSIQRDVNGEPYIDYVSCKIQKNTGDKIEILPTDNLYYSINGVSLTQGAYVPLAKDDGIEYIEFILMPTEGDRFGSAKFGEAKFASPIARTTVQIINDVKPAALRGPSEWKPNVEYLGGGRGESFQDIVMHTKDGVVEYYLCHVSHIGVEPGADTSLNTHWTKDKPWEKSQANDFVATKVMFAQRSVIVNLALNDAKAYPMKKDAEGHYTDVLDTEATPTISIDGNTGEMTANGGTFNDITANRGTFNNVTVNKNSTFYGTLKASVIQTDAYACDNEGTWRDIDIENDPHTTYDISFWVFYYTQIQVAHLPNASLYEGVELEFRGMSNRQTEVGLVEGYIKIFYKGAERVISGFRTDGYVKVKAIAGYWVILNYHGSLRVIYNNKERYITEENYADLYDGNEIEVDIFHDVFIVSEGTPSGIVLPRPYTMSKCHVRVITSGTEFYWKCPDGYGINYSNQSISGNQKQYRTHCIELYSSGAAWHELFFSN